MVGCNKELLVNVVKHKNISTVLEIGSGKCSTRLMRSVLKSKRGHCTSLETNDFWFKKMNKLCSPDKNGTVIKSRMVWQNDRLFLDFESKSTFDFILIDGPSVNKDINRKIYNKLVKFTSNKNLWIKPFDICGGGPESMHMLEYVSRFFKKNTFVLVDFRLAAVYYYLQHFMGSNEFDFYGVVDDSFIRTECIHKHVVSDKFWEDVGMEKIIKHRPTAATFICKKGNKIIHDIFKDINVNVVPLL